MLTIELFQLFSLYLAADHYLYIHKWLINSIKSNLK